MKLGEERGHDSRLLLALGGNCSSFRGEELDMGSGCGGCGGKDQGENNEEDQLSKVHRDSSCNRSKSPFPGLRRKNPDLLRIFVVTTFVPWWYCFPSEKTGIGETV
jgi:hypothetical protein